MGSTSSVGHVGCQWMDSRGRDLWLGSMNHVTWELRKSKRNCIFFALPQVSPKRYLIQSLKRRGAHPKIIQEAAKFRCTVCEETCRPQPRNFASLEPQPQRFDTLTADVRHFIHPHTGVYHQFLLMVDEGSRFKVGRIITCRVENSMCPQPFS